MNKVKKIVLTGGPCGGKSAVLKALSEAFRGKVIIIPETATELLETPPELGGTGVPGKDFEWTQEWQNNFQEKILLRQLEKEARAREIAENNPEIELIICDRGILDGAAYTSGGLDTFLTRFGLSQEECHLLYDKIIHLSSLATDNPAKFEEMRKSNPIRYEGGDLAKNRELDRRTYEAWKDHPQQTLVGATDEIEQKIAYCKMTIEWLMSPELESLHEGKENEKEVYLRLSENKAVS